jgi:hypothetical protein
MGKWLYLLLETLNPQTTDKNASTRPKIGTPVVCMAMVFPVLVVAAPTVLVGVPLPGSIGALNGAVNRNAVTEELPLGWMIIGSQ